MMHQHINIDKSNVHFNNIIVQTIRIERDNVFYKTIDLWFLWFSILKRTVVLIFFDFFFNQAREFELWSPPNLAEQSTDDEQDLSEEGACDADERESIREQYLAYRSKVKAFLDEPMFDHRPTARASVVADDDDDDDSRPTDLLRVDRVDKSITADQLYAAFSRYGKVLWVRVLPGGYSWPSVYPYNSARVCFDRTESVDRVLADHQGPGCTIKGVPVYFSKSKPGQWLTTKATMMIYAYIGRYIIIISSWRGRRFRGL